MGILKKLNARIEAKKKQLNESIDKKLENITRERTPEEEEEERRRREDFFEAIGQISDFLENPPAPLDSWRGIETGKTKTEVNIEKVIEYYNPKKGRLRSWWSRGKAESRTKLLTVLNQEQTLAIQQGAMLEQAALNSERARQDFQVFVAKNHALLWELQAKEQLIEQALQEGLTVESDQRLKVESGLSRVRLGEERERSDVKVAEHYRLKQIELEARWQEILQDSDSADLAQMGDHLIIKKLRKDLREAKEERYELRTSDRPPELKAELLADYDKFITRLEAKIDGREGGHPQDTNGGQKKGQAEAPNSGTGYPPESDED